VLEQNNFSRFHRTWLPWSAIRLPQNPLMSPVHIPGQPGVRLPDSQSRKIWIGSDDASIPLREVLPL
ncbi:MAG: hypothetical protein PHF57_08550, partial [Methanoregula sp.]|nr:hypothetical protein [Methanoregula sp.]